MIRKITLLFLGCLSMAFMANAQLCGFDQTHQQHINQNPAYAQAVQQANNQIASMIANPASNALIVNTPNGLVYEIPVVVHVIHTGGPIGSNYNPTDAQLTAMVDYLNDTYEATWPSYPDVNNGGTFIPLRFVLAKRDPNCNATTGIVRVDGSSLPGYVSGGVHHGTTGADEVDVKNLSRWPNTQYYNIWVVNRIDGKDGYPGTVGPYVAGFAYFPGAGAQVDGTIMLASQSVAGEETLPHEIGHAFNLYHTFEGDGGGGSCPPAGPCATTGDRVCDTDPHMRSPFNCPDAQINTCTGTIHGTVVHNIMDYSNCADRFTAGQRDRVVAALLTQRSSLITSLGSVAPTTTLPVACIPGITIPGNSFNAGPRDIDITQGATTYMAVTSSGYNGDGNLAYIDNTCTHQVTLTAGQTYDFSVRTGFQPEKVRVYVDYNNDGTFQAGEEIYSHDGTQFNETHTFAYTVPTTGVTNCVPLRMRVVSDRSVVTSVTACGPLSYGQAEDYSIVIQGGTTGTGAVTVALTNGGNPSCFNTGLTFTATPVAGIINPTFQWYVNSQPVPLATTNPWSSNMFNDDDTVKVKMYFNGLCGPDSSWSDSVIVQRVATVAPAVSIALTNGTNPGCPNQPLQFTATPTSNPGGNPTYVWLNNGIVIPGAIGPIFTSSTLANGSNISVVMTSSSSCAVPVTATSNIITVQHQLQAPVINISVTGGTNPGCPGQSYIFTANANLPGTSPQYRWRVNGTIVAITSIPTFNAGTLSNGAVVSCDLVTNSTCATTQFASSNSVTIQHTTMVADINISQTGGTNPACSGDPATFQAQTVNAGTGPGFQWLINGNMVLGANNQTFVTSSLQNGDVVTCVLIAPDPCVSNTLDTSNGVTMFILPTNTPSISVAVTQGNNPGCLDSLIEFTTTISNLGTNPNIVWLVNGAQVATGTNVFSSTTLQNGDVLVVRANQTDNGCYTSDTIFTAPVTLTLSPTPQPPVISLIGNMLVADQAGDYIWFGPNGQIPGATGQSYHPEGPGVYYAKFNDNGCPSLPSNLLTITLLSVGDLNTDNMKIYPNPTNGKLILDFGSVTDVSIDVYSALGQGLMHEDANNTQRKEMNLSHLAAGTYYLVLKNNAGEVATVKVTLTK